MTNENAFQTDLAELERELAERADVADLMNGIAILTSAVGAHRMTAAEALAELASGKVTMRGLLAGIHGQYGPSGHA